MLITKSRKDESIKIYVKKNSGEYKQCSSLCDKKPRKKNDLVWEDSKRGYYLLPFKYYSRVIRTFPDSKFSKNFIEYIDIYENKRFKKKIKDKRLKRKLTSLLKNNLIDLKLREFQKDGAIFGLDRLCNRKEHSVIIADDMGLGKTYSALSLMLSLKKTGDVKSCLIVCPGPAKEIWMNAIRDHTNEQFLTIENSSCLNSRVENVIITYDQFRVLNERIYDYSKFDLIIIDEFHKIKNPYAQRTEVVKGFNPTYKIFLSGTPILNRTDELWSTLNFINPEKYENLQGFVNEYCVQKNIRIVFKKYGRYYTRFIKKIVGAKRVTKLRLELKKIMIRRRKKDVLKELPDKTYQNLFVNLKPKQEKAYNKLTKELIVQIDKKNITVENAMAKFIRLRQICESLGSLGEKDVSSKLDLMEELVGDLTNEGHKVFIVSYFKTVTKLIKERLKKYHPAYVDGDVSDKAMTNEIRKFHKNKSCRVYVGTITKNMEAIDLTAADHIIFVGKHLVQKLNEQVEDRLHRMNQKKNVNVISILCRNTVEERIEDMLLKKEELFDDVIEGGKIGKKISLGQIKRLITKRK